MCFAPQTTLPKPLLSKVCFGIPSALFKDINHNPSQHGLGRTSGGGGRGMAVLEGLVAVLEVRDVVDLGAVLITDDVV